MLFATWKGRAQEARQAVDDIQVKLDALEQRVRELRSDDGRGRATEVNRERAVRQDIAAALDEIATLQAKRSAAQEKLEKVLEDARREGVPPGELE